MYKYNRKIYSVCLTVICLTKFVLSYNLEDRLPLFKYGPAASTFGFSVALHRTSEDDTTGIKDTLLVVGAPTASAMNPEDANAPRNPGGVFYCVVSTDPADCTRVVMDSEEYSENRGLDKIFIRDNQWLGVSLKSQGPAGFLVSCAHRFTQHLHLGPTTEYERVCGKCFLLNVTETNEIQEIPPDSASLSTKFISSLCDVIFERALNTFKMYGYMQAGTSISLHNKQYLLGAPGTWSWTGAMFDIDMPETLTTSGLSDILDEEFQTARVYETPTCYKDEKDGLKCHRLPVRRDSYIGFSVATSNSIMRDSDELYYVAGAPRGNNTGTVVFFRKEKSEDDDDERKLNPDLLNTVTVEAIGSSFGYSIELTDINSDGLDDLIVGAPQYYEYNNQHKRGGAVYIYINLNTGFRNVQPQVFYGPLDSFFGHSVAALGDIDQDGFNDFAVGSPYENQNGAVHIFRGSVSGNIKESQVINAADYSFVPREITGFGASLSGNIDVDSNKYPDLLIGTYSDQVALIRSRPIISANMTFEIETSEIDLSEKNCTSGGEEVACFLLRYCFEYTARHSEYSEEVPIEYKLELDSIRQDDMRSSRVHIGSYVGPSIVRKKVVLPKAGERVCPDKDYHTIYFNNGAKDKLSDIGIKLEFDLDFKKVERERVGEEVFRMINDPILDADLDNKKKKIVRIKTSCGDDGCQSDLKISATMPEEIVVGDDKILPLKIDVVNDGEEAHQAFITISIPENIGFNDYNVSQPATPTIVCYTATSGDSSFIRCDFGNPYRPDTHDVIEIYLGVSRLTAEDKSIEVEIKGQTSSENPKIATINLLAQVIIELDVLLNAYAQPEQVRYGEREILGETGMKKTQDIGPLIVYTFNVINEGRQPASGVILNVELPIEIRNGKWLLYLVTSDIISDRSLPAGSCGSKNVNILQLYPSLQASENRRKRRELESYSEIAPEAEATRSGGFISKVTLACKNKNTRCSKIRCELDDMEPLSTTSATFQLRVWDPTFLEEFTHVDLVYIRTFVKLSTTVENVRFKNSERTSGTVQTTVDHEFFKTDIISTFPWWYILIGVLLCLLIFMLILCILSRCGFFKRKRFEDEDESEVLEEVRQRDDQD